MRKLKIGKRLFLSFIFILILVIASAVYSASKMYKMSEDSDLMFAYNIDSLYHLDDANVFTNYLMVTVRQAFVVRDYPEQFTNALNEFNRTKDNLNTSLNLYKEILYSNPNRTQKGEELFNEVTTLWNEYRPIVESLINYLRLGESGNALEIFLNPSNANIANKLSALVLELFNYNIEQARLINIQQNEDSHYTILIVIVATVISVILSIIIGYFVSRSITVPVQELKKVMSEVSVGNLNIQVDSNMPDELGDLTRSVSGVMDTINAIMNDINEMAVAFDAGDIEYRINTSKFEGNYKLVAQGVNRITSDIIEQVLSFFSCLGAFCNGDFDADMKRMPGKKVLMNESLDKLRNNLKSVVSDVASLIEHASKGEMSNRVDTNKYNGDWAKLLNSLNELLEIIISPINEAADVLDNVSQGNFDYKVQGNYKGDFLKIKVSINKTIDNIASYIGEISKVLNAMSNNDLTQEITREYIGEFSEIKTALNSIIEKFNYVIADVLSAANQVSSGARQISQSNLTLAQGTTEQASSIEALNASIMQINESTIRNANEAKEAETLATFSKENAERGNHDMQEMLVSMDSINNSSAGIAKIIKVIDDIAMQTNLLALNAAVEAARAGEHGKGFAVVADQVRNLAGKSQQSAKETAILIEKSIDQVDEGTKIADTTADALNTIVDGTVKVSKIITEIADASNHQAEEISHIALGISQITEVIQSNSATSEETAAASQELSSQSELLKNLVSVFKLKNK